MKTATSSAAMTPAEKDKADRQAIIAGLEAQLKKGDKALVGNSAYRPYLKASGKNFKIDLGKLAEKPGTTVSPWCGPTRT